MDIFLPIVIFIVLFILFFICGLCCRRKTQGQIFNTPVIITSTTHEPVDGAAQQTAYQNTNAAPYPGTQPGYNATAYPPYPQAAYPPAQPYPPQHYPIQPPYPLNNPQVMPQPMQSSVPAANVLPPPYSEVVRSEAYSKQAPFNPNY
ncbi:protein shisa-5-like [Ctenocephalides felis]|uniref:protein shisa-5-like n=1 Tax=Ctenocephalides felis TaxID=7515 RepID=UPI000E6E347B|nr:protein shisa-5-like [Ctenocephalides felis]XP_026474388.1 protein shisa-5-like [Ctenocephalides felis]